MLKIFTNIINGAKLVLKEIEEDKVKQDTEKVLELTKQTKVEDK